MSIIKLWKNRHKIIEGIKYKIFKDKYVESVYQERMNICKTCPNINLSGTKCYVPGTQPCCGVCGCSLELLLRSPSSECEDGRWSAKIDE